MLAEEDVNLIDLFGLIALITSCIGLTPQIYKTYKTKSAVDISYLMLYNYLVCSIAWIVYGIFTKADFVLYSNIMGTITSLISIFQKKIYAAAKTN